MSTAASPWWFPVEGYKQSRVPSMVSGSPKKRLKSTADDDGDEQLDCCGICYAERGLSVAGEIDCCSHHFCFACIMEWAKHESRCPICRQRFSNVRRLPKPGVLSSSRDVKVPLRDQVYHPYGNVTTGPVDSYPQAICSICHAGTDENLLLLCDLCDTASHTYCLGLGYTVPEGNWFCPDCAISRQTNSSSHFQLHQQNFIPLPDRLTRFKGKRPVLGVQYVQRNVHSFRQNWNALRSGSRRFHSNSLLSDALTSLTQDSNSLSHGKSDEAHSLASATPQLSTARVGPSSSTLNDVDKAWKMMDRAKMMQRKCTSSAHCSYRELKNQQSRSLDLRCTRMEKQPDYSNMDKNFENRQSLKLGEKRQSRVTCEMIQHVRNHTTQSEGYCEPPLPRKIATGVLAVPCCNNSRRNVVKEQISSAGLATSGGSAPSHAKFCRSFSPVWDEGIFNEENGLAKSVGDANTIKSEDAKTEIQSLVKLNLKFLTRDKQLAVNTFKAVAREATHAILAACRSEQQNSNTSSSSVCSHNEHIRQFQKSSLLPNCCRQCFYCFVNNVVNSVLEKVG